jgi:hypothetical protein
VYSLVPVPDKTSVTVTASNEDYPNAHVRNHTSEFKNNVAEFSDLRFVGRSGRTKPFDVTITIATTPLPTVAVLAEVIKVQRKLARRETVDKGWRRVWLQGMLLGIAMIAMHTHKQVTVDGPRGPRQRKTEGQIRRRGMDAIRVPRMCVTWN